MCVVAARSRSESESEAELTDEDEDDEEEEDDDDDDDDDDDEEEEDEDEDEEIHAVRGAAAASSASALAPPLQRSAEVGEIAASRLSAAQAAITEALGLPQAPAEPTRAGPRPSASASAPAPRLRRRSCSSVWRAGSASRLRPRASGGSSSRACASRGREGPSAPAVDH